MKLSIALTMLASSAAAFSSPSFVSRTSSLKSAVAESTYTFEKSEEIFEEAKTVSNKPSVS